MVRVLRFSGNGGGLFLMREGVSWLDPIADEGGCDYDDLQIILDLHRTRLKCPQPGRG